MGQGHTERVVKGRARETSGGKQGKGTLKERRWAKKHGGDEHGTGVKVGSKDRYEYDRARRAGAHKAGANKARTRRWEGAEKDRERISQYNQRSVASASGRAENYRGRRRGRERKKLRGRGIRQTNLPKPPRRARVCRGAIAAALKRCAQQKNAPVCWGVSLSDTAP